ncbi:MAG TPA: porin [Stellaceae bacterium]|jgi:phosphate-selective porin OprO/OprP
MVVCQRSHSTRRPVGERSIPALAIAGTALFAAIAVASPAAAQTVQQMREQMQQLQQQLLQQMQQIQAQQQTIQQLQDRLAGMSSTVEKQQQDLSTVKAEQEKIQEKPPAVAAAGPGTGRIGPVNGRLGIYTTDAEGRQTGIALVGRLQFDVGDYFQTGRPGPDARTAPDLNSGYNLRRGRIGVTGRYLGDWQYDFVGEFGGVNTNELSASILTASASYLGLKPVIFTIGYQDVFASFAEAVSSADITFNERPAISNITNSIAGSEPRAAFATIASGERWYAAGYLSGSQAGVAGNDEQAAVVGRAVYLPVRTEDAFLHVGINGSYVFQPNQNIATRSAAGINSTGGAGISATTIALSDRPELRIDPTPLINTGTINATHADTYGIELAGSWKSLWFDGEYQIVGVDQLQSSSATPAPFLTFDGGYGEVGWFITGEHRPYSTARAAWTTLQPKEPFSPPHGGWGAWEIAARYSHANLNDHANHGVPTTVTGGVFGGVQDIFQIGLNWYPTTNVRFLLDYLFADVNKFAANGINQQGQRFQAVALRTQINW